MSDAEGDRDVENLGKFVVLTNTSSGYQHPVPDTHLRHVGDIVVSFALLEFVVQTLAYDLLGEDPRVGQIVTTELSFSSLRALTLSLYRERRGEDGEFTRLKELMARAVRVEDRRNQIMHSVWGELTDGRIMRIKTTAKVKRGLHSWLEFMAEEDLESFAREIKGLTEDFQRFGPVLR